MINVWHIADRPAENGQVLHITARVLIRQEEIRRETQRSLSPELRAITLYLRLSLGSHAHPSADMAG